MLRRIAIALALCASACLAADAPKLAGGLFVYCAAGMRLPIEQIARDFEKSAGVKIELTYDGSNKLLGQIELTRKGDVYITGDADYLDMAKQKGFVASQCAICRFVPVIMVKKGNPLGVKTLADLLKPKVRIGQGDPKAAAIGRIMPRLLQLSGIDSAGWKANVVVVTATVNELANAIKLGTIDAAVVWNAIAASYPDAADAVAIDSARNVFPQVGGAVLTFCANRAAAQSFLDYVTGPAGRSVLARNGYSVAGR